jgi:hypothetical protein
MVPCAEAIRSGIMGDGQSARRFHRRAGPIGGWWGSVDATVDSAMTYKSRRKARKAA